MFFLQKHQNPLKPIDEISPGTLKIKLKCFLKTCRHNYGYALRSFDEELFPIDEKRLRKGSFCTPGVKHVIAWIDNSNSAELAARQVFS